MVDTRGLVRLDPIPSNDTPTMGELNKYLIKYCELWRSIGYKLGLEDDVLTVIQSNHPMQTVECFREVLQKWLKQDVRPTWSTLELAITNARRDELGLKSLEEGVVQQLNNQPKEHGVKEHGVKRPRERISSSDLSVHFSSFVMAIRKILEECKDKMEECKELCCNLTISGNSDVLLFNDEELMRINKCTSFQQLFMILRKHWNWKEYSILKTIIAICDSEEAEAELDKFEKIMSSYCGMKLLSDKYSPDELPENYVKLCITIDKPYKSLTLQDFVELRTFIFKYLDVQKYIALPFIKFLFSSLHLEWYIPIQAVSHVIKAVHQSIRFFIQKSIILIEIEDNSILDVQHGLLFTDGQTGKFDRSVEALDLSFPDSRNHSHMVCPKCRELFKNPKCLPCYHSYCEECLEKMRDHSMITCLKCKNETMAVDGAVKNLPTNYLLDHLVNKLMLNYKLKNKTELRCEKCKEENLLVAVFCTDCKLFLCCYCKESHKYSKSHHTHILISLTEMKSNKELIQSNCKFPKCQQHDLELENYCETCKKLVCIQCTREHEGHKCDSVRKFANKYQSKLEDITASIQVKRKDVSKLYNSIMQQIALIRQQGDEYNKEIDSYYNEVSNKLLVKQEVLNTVIQKENSLVEQLKEVKCIQEDISDILKIGDAIGDSDEEILSGGNQLIYFCNNLAERCENLGYEPIGSIDIKVTFGNNPPEVNFATIDSPCFEIESYVQLRQAVEVKIITKDINRDCYHIGDCEVTAVAVETKTRKKTTAQVTSNNNGTYTIYFTAQQAGMIDLLIFMNGDKIKESPFQITVQENSRETIYDDRFGELQGIACSNGSMWAVADSTNNCVHVYCWTKLVKRLGSRGKRNGQFKCPCDVAFDYNNELYVSDSHNHRVQKFDTHGNYLLQFGGNGNAKGQLKYPKWISTHHDKVYVADHENNRISVFQISGEFYSVIGQQQLSQSFSIAVNINEILAADWVHHCIYIFSTEDGRYIDNMTLKGTDNLSLERKTFSFTADSDGFILMADTTNHCISRFDNIGRCLSLIGSEGSNDDEFKYPSAVAIASNGNIYVSDTGNKRVQIFPRDIIS